MVPPRRFQMRNAVIKTNLMDSVKADGSNNIRQVVRPVTLFHRNCVTFRWIRWTF